MIKNSTFLNFSRLHQRLIFLLGFVLVLFSSKLTAQTVLADFAFTGNSVSNAGSAASTISWVESGHYFIDQSTTKYDTQRDYISTKNKVKEGAFGDGYVVLKIKTEDYTNLVLTTLINGDSNKDVWQIYANTTGIAPSFIRNANGGGDHIRSWIVVPSKKKWGTTTDNLPAKYENLSNDLYIYFKPLNSATGNSDDHIVIDNIKITGCKLPNKPTITAPTVCVGSQLNPAAPIVLETTKGWQMESGVGTGVFSNITFPVTASMAH